VSRFSKILIGTSSALFIILLALFFALRSLVVKSFPVTNGTLGVSGLHSPVDIYRDTYGIPHISAHDDHDLMFATGYIHAQDRLWQMELGRRAGQGRLSEILGSATIDYDLLFRTLGLSQHADTLYRRLHDASRQILTDYAEGINAYIADNKGKYPIEFDMLNFEPEPWKPEHSLLIGRLMAWELNLAWWTDLAYGEIAAKVPAEKLQEIIPRYEDSIAITMPSLPVKKSLSDIHDLLEIGKSYRNFFGLGSLEAGSNGWAVDSSRSLSGKPLLANDPHLAMPAPSRWYEVHLSSPGWNVAGVSLPGVPVVIIGHNEHAAWGLTNAMIDDADFYVEKLDSLNPKRYVFQKSSRQIEEREEKILVKGADSIVFVARATFHGPIINDVHPTHKHQQDSVQAPISMRWTGLDVSDEIYGFYLMNRATTVHEFERGIQEIAVPGQSVVYADVHGNIASWTAGKIPIRDKHLQPMLPMSGWSGDAEWKDFIPFDQLPKTINPADGIIASANQKIGDARFPYYVSTLWEPSSRIQRIRQLLHSTDRVTTDDFQQFQQDIVSPYARDITRMLLDAHRDSSRNTQNISEALNYLRNWDYRFAQNDAATTIFNVFIAKLFHNTFEDELGKDVFNDFVFFGAIPYRVTNQLLSADSSLWFDNVTTSTVETKDDILRQSLSDAIAELQQSMGDEMKNWQWGKLHTVTFKHLFGSRKPLDNIFNIGPFPISGGGTTVMKTEYKFTAPYGVSAGPSMRQIIDLSQPLDALTVITSGQSGQPLNKHYDDQTPLWLNGGYLRVTMDWEHIKNEHWDHLILNPR
jgi:penicillin amidase